MPPATPNSLPEDGPAPRPQRHQSSLPGNPLSAREDNVPLGSNEKTHHAGQSTAANFHCQHHSSPGRNLVVCIDGTANQFSEKNTNVVELYSRLIKSKEQLTYYNSGIGTFASDSKFSWSHWKQTIDYTIDMAIAWNFKRIVLSAYQWLSDVYEDGDRIFLFGFSRGAYQVRVIAGMIERVGLLHKGNNDQIAFAYELYISTTESSSRADSDTRGQPTGLLRKRRQRKASTALSKGKLCARFKNTLSRHGVKVHFVGVWDTVSSIGVARAQSYPETTSGMGHVCVFRHGMALDELRVKFLPEYADGGAGPSGGGNVKEVWFRGSHSDIGGGNSANMELDKFGPALRWMTYESIEHGLKMTPYQGEWSDLNPTKSLTGVWYLLEVFPFRRLSYKGKESTTSWPHLGRPRLIQKGHLIHQSVANSVNKEGYVPKALISAECLEAVGLSSGSDKSRLTAKILEESRLTEQDLYASTGTILEDLNDVNKVLSDDAWLHRLTAVTASKIGLQSIIESPGALDAIITSLNVYRDLHEHPKKALEVRKALLKALIAFPYQPRDTRKYSNTQIKEALHGLHASLMALFKIFSCVGTPSFQGHNNGISSVAYSPDGTLIASGSWDHTIRIWDSQTGDIVMGPLEGHTNAINSVAFSPDGSRLVSGSDDCTVRIWDLKTGQEAISPLQGHQEWVSSVSFSPDGKHIASGSEDRTVRIWDAQTGQEAMEPLGGHIDCVRSVAFPPDGQLIVSGSDDRTIRIWDAKTGKPTDPLDGHSHYVLCVAFSPNSKYIASGSFDHTVRIWDAATGKQVMEPFMGHAPGVSSVAFSPDGTRIVSGSYDDTIRVWDVATGKEVVEPLRGHTEPVYSVAVSPDGERIVSGSDDRTIRVWDMKSGEQLLGPVE